MNQDERYVITLTPEQEIIRSLRDQARDKEALANGDADSIFAQDAKALREAADLLEKLREEP